MVPENPSDLTSLTIFRSQSMRERRSVSTMLSSDAAGSQADAPVLPSAAAGQNVRVTMRSGSIRAERGRSG